MVVIFADATKLEAKDLMSVTTAYAAVLAVFVGPSTPEDKLGIAEIGAVTGALVRGLHKTVMLVAWLRSSPYRQGTADGILTMVANLKGQATRRCAEGPLLKSSSRKALAVAVLKGMTGDFCQE